jgi:hypothetical protein
MDVRNTVRETTSAAISTSETLNPARDRTVSVRHAAEQVDELPEWLRNWFHGTTRRQKLEFPATAMFPHR